MTHYQIFHSTPIFDRELRPHIKLPNLAEGGLSAWLEEIATIIVRRRKRIGFTQCNGFELCITEYVNSKFCGTGLFKYISLRRHKKLILYKCHKRMFDLGIPVPEPYACLYEYDSQKSLLFSYIIFQKLVGAEELRLCLGEGSHYTIEEKQQLCYQLGRIVANMHKCGYVHRDLGLANIMVDEREIFLIDLDGARRVPSLWTRRHAVSELTVFTLRLTKSRHNVDIHKDTYIKALASFFVAYCKASRMEPLWLMKKIHHRLDIIKNREEKDRKKVREIEFACDAVEHVTGFLENL